MGFPRLETQLVASNKIAVSADKHWGSSGIFRENKNPESTGLEAVDFTIEE